MLPVLLLDGGFSNELAKRCSYNVDEDPLWTAKALLTDAEAVTATHYAYLMAGVDIIETATYQATLPGLKKQLGLAESECEDLIANSVRLAEKAVTQYKSEFSGNEKFSVRQKALQPLKIPLIAGSIGPYGVFLHDGSEYTGSYIGKASEKEIVDLHSKRIELLVSRNINLLALETMPSLAEVEMILGLLERKKLDVKVWVSFTLQENDALRTVCGEEITVAFKAVAKYSNVWGFGTNCVNPKNVSPFLKAISKVRKEIKADNVRLIVYPNVGRTWISGQGWSDEAVPPIAEYAEEWMKLGANVIGGCCLVGPDQIQQLRSVVDKWNSRHCSDRNDG